MTAQQMEILRLYGWRGEIETIPEIVEQIRASARGHRCEAQWLHWRQPEAANVEKEWAQRLESAAQLLEQIQAEERYAEHQRRVAGC